jgi:hypothetical protein
MENDIKELKRKVFEKFPTKGKRGAPPDTRRNILKGVFKFLDNDQPEIPKRYLIREAWSDDQSAKNLKLKMKQLPDYLTKINIVIHGDDPNLLVNEDIPLYLKDSGKNVTALCNDIKAIKIERAKYFNKKGRNKISRYWLKGVVFNYNKGGIRRPKIKIDYEDFISTENSRKGNKISDNFKKIKEIRKKNFEKWKEDTKRGSWLSYPGPTYGVLRINSSNVLGHIEVQFVLHPSDFFYFLAAQEIYRLPRKPVKKQFISDPNPELSHTIGAAGFLIVKKGNTKYAIFAKRSTVEELGTGKGIMGLPICVTPRRKPSPKEKKDLDKGFKCKGFSKTQINKLLKPDRKKGNLFINAIKRGAKEELKINNLSENDIKILAYGLDTQRYLYNVIAIIEKDMQASDIEIGYDKSFFGDFQYETSGIEPILFEPEPIADFIRRLSKSEYCPTTQMAAYYVCLHKFGREAVDIHFKGLI